MGLNNKVIGGRRHKSCMDDKQLRFIINISANSVSFSQPVPHCDTRLIEETINALTKHKPRSLSVILGTRQ